MLAWNEVAELQARGVSIGLISMGFLPLIRKWPNSLAGFDPMGASSEKITFMEKSGKTFLYSVVVFVAGSSYGFITPAVKAASQVGIMPSQFLPLQYLASLVTCIAAMLIGRVKWCGIKRALPMALLGVFTGCTSICFYTSVSLLPSAAALTLLFQYVWIGIAIECIAKRKAPSPSSVGACVVVLIGTVFAAGTFDGALGTLNPMGVMAGAASAVFYALFLYFSGIIGTEESVVLRTTMLSFGGLVVTSIANPAVYMNDFWNIGLWPYAVGFALLGILVPTTLINFASPKLSSGMVTIMASSELPVGVLASWALVGDAPTALVLFGAFLVLMGIFVKQLPALLGKENPISLET